jgi:hypothetical protein
MRTVRHLQLGEAYQLREMLGLGSLFSRGRGRGVCEWRKVASSLDNAWDARPSASGCLYDGMIPEESNLSEYSRDHNRFPSCQSGSRVTKLARHQRCCWYCTSSYFRLRNYFLLRNRFLITLLLLTLFSIIFLIFNTIAVLDFVDDFAQNRRWCLANFVTRESGLQGLGLNFVVEQTA